MAIEDIGLADPRALEQACNDASGSLSGTARVTWRWHRWPSNLSVAPKSDASYRALGAVQADVQRPWQSRFRCTCAMLLPRDEAMGYSTGYEHAHKFDGRHHRDGVSGRPR